MSAGVGFPGGLNAGYGYIVPGLQFQHHSSGAVSAPPSLPGSPSRPGQQRKHASGGPHSQSVPCMQPPGQLGTYGLLRPVARSSSSGSDGVRAAPLEVDSIGSRRSPTQSLTQRGDITVRFCVNCGSEFRARLSGNFSGLFSANSAHESNRSWNDEDFCGPDCRTTCMLRLGGF
jgi:hypothetical protein